MAFARLAESTQSLYSELLDQLIAAEAERVPLMPRRGSFVSKVVRGRRYWYWQQLEGGRKSQRYVGPESEQLLAHMRAVDEQRERTIPDATRRAQLVDMLAAGGAKREAAAVTRVLEVLADAGLFQLGAVIVGTQAFTCYENMLGVRFERATTRTQDIDLAQERSIDVALAPEPSRLDLLETLRRAEPAFLPVPELDPRSPSTSFKVRGRDLRVDLVTPARGRSAGPVSIPWLGAAATPLPFLGYLIEETAQTAVIGGSGVLVNVPRPGRYALHKLWLARQRPVSEQVKARKDLQQAELLLEVLLVDRPQEIHEGWSALERRVRERKAIRNGLVSGRRGTALAEAAALLGHT
ncbi:MAG TPA: GSU2403 family nucleotidyltransferase fold protein [Thermoanaerobaculia bacterium]|jgi:hypothetical protein|nr:GSU2403 family nucleotidyltransferase fold protein [Thermoanaerobaculia bacterium]